MSTLTVGPLVYPWSADARRDLYFRLADEAPVDRVYLGEVVCSKRELLQEPVLAEVLERLRAAGKEVVLSTLALPTTERELAWLEAVVHRGGLVEANDASAISLLVEAGLPFVVGPLVNVLNEATLEVYARLGARRIVLASELSGEAIARLTGARPDLEYELQVHGRQPLALSLRCYSARHAHAHKDSCQLVCTADPHGVPADTMDGSPLYHVNGTQILSHGSLVLVDRLAELERRGVTAFRLSPQAGDFIAVARLHRQVLDGVMAAEEGVARLTELTVAPPINGSYLGREGRAWIGG